jgi:hypothetical protein
MRLLGDGTRFLALWIGAGRGAAATLQDALARWPITVRALAADGALARHLQAGAGSAVLVRPDAYVAARIDAATPERIEAALRQALSLEVTTA